jgi:hypothetical protein
MTGAGAEVRCPDGVPGGSVRAREKAPAGDPSEPLPENPDRENRSLTAAETGGTAAPNRSIANPAVSAVLIILLEILNKGILGYFE